MATIYHVTKEDEWIRAREQGYYEHPSLITEGFIHCCTEAQLPGVLQRYFPGMSHLVKLEIETGKLTAPLKYEIAPSVPEAFPHIYGKINLEAVNRVDMIK